MGGSGGLRKVLDEHLVQRALAVLEHDHARALDRADLDAGISDEAVVAAALLQLAVGGQGRTVGQLLFRANAVPRPRGPGLHRRSHVQQEEPPRVVRIAVAEPVGPADGDVDAVAHLQHVSGRVIDGKGVHSPTWR